MNKIILIEKNPSLRKTLSDALKEEEYDVIPIKSSRDAEEILKDKDIPLAIISTDRTADNPYTAVELVSNSIGEGNIILIIERDEIDYVMNRLSDRIYDYITRPVDLSEFKVVVDSFFKLGDEEKVEVGFEDMGFDDIIGKSPQMKRVYENIKRVSRSDASVLITGESGTGKELVADSIHRHSDRSAGPLVKVHCAALAEGVLESELFGHEKGAFTDAIKLHKGKFEQADGGTLFLDEVSEIPPHTQVKLLRVLENRAFQRVGGRENIETDIRLITATNRDLKSEVSEGRFREDLYWRIRVIEIEIPPLRDRVEDIPLLIDYFIGLFSERDKKEIAGISEEALKVLKANPWYGNVRELRNAVENMVVMSDDDTLDIDDIPDYIKMPGAKGTAIELPVGTSIEEAEKVLIRRTLTEMGGDKERTAEVLGITKKKLLKLLQRYKLVE